MDRLDTNPLSKYLFVHVGCPVVKEEEFISLYRAGFKVLILDDVGIEPKSQCCFEYHKVEFANIDQIIDRIHSVLARSQLTLGHVFTLADGSIDITNSILRYLKISPIYHSDIESIRNKYQMRKTLEKFGYSLPVCDLVELGRPPKNYCSNLFPLIVKPVDSMSSRSVRLVNNQDDLKDACCRAQTESTEVVADHGTISVEKVYHLKQQALIESYLPGTEFSAEVILHNRDIQYITVTSKITSGEPFFIEKGHVAGQFRSDPDFKRRVHELVKAVVDAGQFDTTLLHIEFKENENGMLNLIECNARMGGDQICALTEKATGCNLLISFLRMTVNLLELKALPVSPNAVVLRYFITSGNSGIFTDRAHSFDGHVITWWYSLGDNIGILSSERATRLGVIESQFQKIENLQTFLDGLIEKEAELYQINPERPNGDGPGGGGSSIGKLARKKLNSLFLMGTIAISLIFSLCVALTLREYQSQYIKLFGESLSSSIQQYMSFREILPVAFRISKADAKGWCSRIVVVDNDSRVLYSTSQTGFPTEHVFSTIDRFIFDFSFPIESNGVTEGYVLIDRGYGRILGIFGTLSALFLAFMAGAYLVFVKIFLPMAFSPLEAGVEQLEKILNGLAVELDGLGDRKFSRSLILKGYRKELDNIHTNVKEIAALKRQTDQILDSISKIQSQIDDREKLEDLVNESKRTQEFNLSIGEVMAQVAHDIRSPLSALEILSSSLDSVCEDKRILLRTAVRRISDIAQGLSLRGNKQQSIAIGASGALPTMRLEEERPSVALVSSLISELISEKRIQYHDFGGHLDLDFEINNETYGLFVRVQPIEFKRVISNLVDNSVEAMVNDRQQVTVSLCEDGSNVLVRVKDSGRGIPENRIKNLGGKGNTFGKDSGTGLGLYHAKKRIAEWEGNLTIESELGRGTTITLILPKANTPKWFLSKLNVPKRGLISIVDDDETIHQVWNQRLGQLGLHTALPNGSNGLLHFSSSNSFAYSQVYKRPYRQLYLIDYELIGQEDTGLDMIEKLHLSGRDCVLVTSHWNEPHIRKRCERLDVRLLPKNLAQHIEIGYSQ